LSAVSWVFQSGSYYLIRSFLQVRRQAHPLDGEGHGLRMEEPAIDVVHLFDGPTMWVLEGRMSISIEAGRVAAMARC